MPIDNGNLALKGLDDLFSTEENRQEEQREQVQQIPNGELFPFKNHPRNLFPPFVRHDLLCGLWFTNGIHQPRSKAKRKTL